MWALNTGYIMIKNDVLWKIVCFTIIVVVIIFCKGSVFTLKRMNFQVNIA